VAEFCSSCDLPLQEGEGDTCGVCNKPPLAELVSNGNHFEVVGTDDRVFDEWRPKVGYDENYNKWYVLVQVADYDAEDGEIKCFYDTLDDVVRDLMNTGLHTAQQEED
jgi:hypothetical protein